MITMSLQQLACVFGVEQGSTSQVDFRGVTIDSRKRCDNQLFVAIRGERFDGHDYVEAAYQAGAVAALVETKLECDIPQLLVADCKQAMIQLANYWRHQCKATVIALTGSNGDNAKHLEKWLEIPKFVNATQHDKAHRTRTGDLHKRPIYPRNMIAQKQRSA